MIRKGYCRAPLCAARIAPDDPSPYCEECRSEVWAFRPGSDWELVAKTYDELVGKVGTAANGSNCSSCSSIDFFVELGPYGEPLVRCVGCQRVIYPRRKQVREVVGA